MNANIFRAVGELALGAKRRREAEYASFLSFFRELVETLPAEMTSLFGHMSNVGVTLRDGKTANYGIELTVTDFLWWKSAIEQDGVRFTSGPESLRRSMLTRFSKQAEAYRLEPEERKKLLAMIDPPKA